MTAEQAALIAAAILVGSHGPNGDPQDVTHTAGQFVSWLERNL